MTTLRQWRHIIAKQVAVGLETDKYGKPASFQTPHQGIEIPAVVIWPGGIDDYIDLDADVEPGVSWCAQQVNTTVALIAGQASETAFDLLDEWLDLLPAALELCATDEWWSPYDVPPVITRVPSHQIIEIGGMGGLLSLPVQVTGIRQSHNHP